MTLRREAHNSVIMWDVKISPVDAHDFAVDGGIVQRLLCNERFLVSCHPVEARHIAVSNITCHV